MKHTRLFLLPVFAALLFAAACSGGKDFRKSPVDEYITKLDSLYTYSVILYDAEVEGSTFQTYRHQYKLITQQDSSTAPKEEITTWQEVDEKFFWANENNIGMTLASKGPDGKVTKEAAPPGYNNYVGNSRYGHWVNRGGSSFWEFYGQYAFMSSMLGLGTGPIYRDRYYDYENNYRGRRAYYGTSTGGGSRYGTYGSTTMKNRGSSFQNKVSNLKKRSMDFKQRVAAKTSRSTSGLRSRSGGFGK